MTRMTPHPAVTAVVYAFAALAGLLVAAVVVVNLHIVLGLEDGYATPPADVLEASTLLAVADVALLVAGPVLALAAVARLRARRRRAGPPE
ncbi:hypothetical protein GCM10009641_87140 [Mycobacterium cookii]|uniref:hypothetical protein n=1 Tax=Nocardioides furvisabuli TaxID=375542 RepID=UPI001E5E1D4B|nr:hypothetical protein [Nocardioides furvisabuli]